MQVRAHGSRDEGRGDVCGGMHGAHMSWHMGHGMQVGAVHGVWVVARESGCTGGGLQHAG